MDQVRENLAKLEAEMGKGFGADREPSSGLGSEWSRGLHARDDGHDPEPRPE